MSALRRLWSRLVRRRATPAADFRSRAPALLRDWFSVAAAAGKPRGLTWVGYEPAGEPLFARDGDTLLSLVPVVVRFEPTPDGELTDVPQAREPRPVVAVFRHRNGRWQTDGRAVYNLTPRELLDRSRLHPEDAP